MMNQCAFSDHPSSLHQLIIHRYSTKKNPTVKRPKAPMMSSTTLILMIACLTTVITAASIPGETTVEHHHHINTNARLEIEGEEEPDVSIQRRSPGKSRTKEHGESCFSLNTNDSYPAAHIVGYLHFWTTRGEVGYYKGHWMCNKRHNSFVDGGMYFNQTDQKLYVPRCGYYQVSSQVYFSQLGISNTQAYAHHQLFVESNCEWSHYTQQTDAFAVNGTGSGWVTTTYTGKIFKLCAGGKIYVRVPKQDPVPCCPAGAEMSSFFSAHLVQGTDCNDHRNRMLTTKPTEQDYQRYYSGNMSLTM